MITTKKVNITANIPIKTVTPPIYGVKKNITMTISDIMKCLTRRAIVEQVLSDGSTVRLTDKNFRYDFEAELQERLRAEKINSKIVTPPTGNIDDLNLVDDIDDDDDDNDEEPDEDKNNLDRINSDATESHTDNSNETDVVADEPDANEDNETEVETNTSEEVNADTEHDSETEVTEVDDESKEVEAAEVKTPNKKKSNSKKK